METRRLTETYRIEGSLVNEKLGVDIKIHECVVTVTHNETWVPTYSSDYILPFNEMALIHRYSLNSEEDEGQWIKGLTEARGVVLDCEKITEKNAYDLVTCETWDTRLIAYDRSFACRVVSVEGGKAKKGVIKELVLTRMEEIPQ